MDSDTQSEKELKCERPNEGHETEVSNGNGETNVDAVDDVTMESTHEAEHEPREGASTSDLTNRPIGLITIPGQT